MLHDEQMAMLLQHIPQSLDNFFMHSFMCNMLLTFCEIGQLKKLTRLRIDWDYETTTRAPNFVCSTTSMAILVDSIETLPLLEQVELMDWFLENPKASLEPMVCALGEMK
jgi:hypothetical protein